MNQPLVFREPTRNMHANCCFMCTGNLHGTINHWFPLIRPAIRAVFLGGGTLDSHDANCCFLQRLHSPNLSEALKERLQELLFVPDENGSNRWRGGSNNTLLEDADRIHSLKLTVRP